MDRMIEENNISQMYSDFEQTKIDKNYNKIDYTIICQKYPFDFIMTVRCELFGNKAD